MDLALGLIRADGLVMDRLSERFEQDLAALLVHRRAPLSETELARVRAARDVLRNGKYKPTGRGKPASEYLLRAADGQEGSVFPRINTAVDITNYISLRHLLPVSLWDVDRSGVETFSFRLGRAGEAYVFNTAGQRIDLEDLVIGTAEERPIVNPVKDSMATKTDQGTRRIAACIYVPTMVVSLEELDAICREFAAYLEECGEDPAVSTGSLPPGEQVTL